MPETEAALERTPMRTVAAALAAVIVVAGGLGAAYSQARPGEALDWTGVRRLRVGLDQEWGLAAFTSGAILAAGAYAGWLLVRRLRSLERPWTGVALLAGMLAFMAVDETTEMHENLQEVFDITWLLLYSPLMLVAAVGWLLTVRTLCKDRPAVVMLVAGAACWAVAQLFEHLQRANHMLVHRWMILPEEVLEMCGSGLFFLALLHGAQWLRADPRAS